MSAELLASVEVVRTVSRILRAAGVPPQDLNDGVADVQCRVLHSLRNRPHVFWPQAPENWKALAIATTRAAIIDRWRKAKRRKKAGDAGLVAESPDEHVAESRRLSERDPLDQQKGIELVEKLLSESKKRSLDEKILEGLLDDKDQVQIAAEMGLSHQQIRDRVRKIRATFAAKVTATFGTGALVLLVALGFSRGPHEPRYSLSAPVVALTEASPDQRAAHLREAAVDPCRDSKWDRCLELLDAAASLDPASDQAVAVQAVRDRAKQAVDDQLRELEAKPSWVPQKAPKAPPKH